MEMSPHRFFKYSELRYDLNQVQSFPHKILLIILIFIRHKDEIKLYSLALIYNVGVKVKSMEM